MKYRLYIDEVGNSDMGASSDPNHRYLNLTGVIVELEYARIIHTEMEILKRQYFNSHPDEPLVFHRRELVRRLRPFQSLNSPTVRQQFDEALLEKLKTWKYTVVSVTIDKLELQQRYSTWQYHPYHYCLHVLLERYIMYLERQQKIGDVMAEARGKREDRALATSFTRIYTHGTEFIAPERFQKVISSREIKLKHKSNNIAGLQLSDLIASPSHKYILYTRRKQQLENDFSKNIIDILISQKYLRKPKTQHIHGWGIKWLP